MINSIILSPTNPDVIAAIDGGDDSFAKNESHAVHYIYFRRSKRPNYGSISIEHDTNVFDFSASIPSRAFRVRIS